MKNDNQFKYVDTGQSLVYLYIKYIIILTYCQSIQLYNRSFITFNTAYIIIIKIIINPYPAAARSKINCLYCPGCPIECMNKRKFSRIPYLDIIRTCIKLLQVKRTSTLEKIRCCQHCSWSQMWLVFATSVEPS